MPTYKYTFDETTQKGKAFLKILEAFDELPKSGIRILERTKTEETLDVDVIRIEKVKKKKKKIKNDKSKNQKKVKKKSKKQFIKELSKEVNKKAVERMFKDLIYGK